MHRYTGSNYSWDNQALNESFWQQARELDQRRRLEGPGSPAGPARTSWDRGAINTIVYVPFTQSRWGAQGESLAYLHCPEPLAFQQKEQTGTAGLPHTQLVTLPRAAPSQQPGPRSLMLKAPEVPIRGLTTLTWPACQALHPPGLFAQSCSGLAG